MSGPAPLLLTVTAPQRAILTHIARCSTEPYALVQRARLILAAADGASNDALARHFGLHRQTICRWRARWYAQQAVLPAHAAADPATDPLPALVRAVLTDSPRCGTPPTFTAEQVVGIVALACEPPAASQRPISQWTPRELADEAIARGLVDTISPRTVGRFLKSSPITAASQPLLAQPQARAPGGIRGGGADGL
jgi:putative transposase